MNTYRTHRHRCGMNNLFKRIGMMSLAVSLLAACATDDDVPDSSVTKTDRDEYTLTLTLSAGSLASRSSEPKLENGTADDSFINVADDDYAVFIFDGDDNFMQRFEPGAVSLTRKEGTDYYKYVINGAFKPVRKLEKGEIKIMILANQRTDFGGDYLTFEENASELQTLSQICAENTLFNFTMPVASGSTSWTPKNDETGKTGIPMFGLAAVVAKEKDHNHNMVEWIPDNEIPMLRSLAKIEIVDMVPNGQSANIEKCVLTNYNTSGRFIPDVTNNSDWGTPNIQVKVPSLPQGVQSSKDDERYSEELYFVKATKSVLPEGATTKINRDCFVVYVPEMELTELTDENRPEIKVYIKGVVDPYTITLSDYNEEGKPKTKADGSEIDYYKSLLRNHLYRYNVKSVGVNAELTLLIETPDWNDTPDQEWTYTDADATFAENGTFAWDNPQWDNSDIYDQDRILLVTDEEGAEGRFTLTGPQGGTWTISLFADDDTRNDHFRIDVWNGMEWQSYGDTATGNIDGREVRIRIIATAANGTAVDYTARMVMTVKTFDDRVANVKLTKNAEYNPSNDTYYYVVKQLTNGGDNM